MRSTRLPENHGRYEIKAVFHQSLIKDVLLRLKLNPLMLGSPHNQRIINNLYFDTHSYATAESHLLGSPMRTKVRLRWYGDVPFGSDATLELKWKHHQFNWKKSFTVPRGFYKPGFTWRYTLENIKNQLSTEGQSILAFYRHPTLINQYSRRYFATHDGSVRVTVDENWKSIFQSSSIIPKLSGGVVHNETAILEIKCQKEHAEVGHQVLSNLCIPVSRNSKYLKGLYCSFSF